MIDNAVQVNQFLMRYTKMLTDDIADDKMTAQPHDGVNHPAWILGHLALTAQGVLGSFGGSPPPAEWKPLYGAGSKPTTTRSAYPSKEELVRTYEQSYEKLRQAVSAATAEQLGKPTTNPRMKDILPTAKEMLTFLLTGHVGVHLGQLSTWRRLMGMPPMF